MKGWHWLLLAAAVGIFIAEQLISASPNQAGRYLLFHYILEIAYFIVLLILGTAIGRLVQQRLRKRQDKAEYVKSIRTYRFLAFLFVVAAGLYMMTGWIPGWIGKHVIFIGGYYYGLSRLREQE
ncbi:hypothetical protein [Effusibacillus consociatus]|uniref:ATP synthase subunit I n=1 Tax=Effusibacillus consociatus TaxID=1117041 RepID=A0ABV9QB22_9BACL